MACWVLIFTALLGVPCNGDKIQKQWRESLNEYTLPQVFFLNDLSWKSAAALACRRGAVYYVPIKGW
jgi:hypothetical protein